MSSRNSRSPGGFTLVETLVAGVILALSAVVLGTTVSQGVRSLALARDYQRGAELLDKTLTKIDLIGPGRIFYEGPSEGVFAPPHERFFWEVRISPRDEGHLYEITVRIMWETPSGVRSTEAQTLLNDPPGSRRSELLWDDL